MVKSLVSSNSERERSRKPNSSVTRLEQDIGGSPLDVLDQIEGEVKPSLDEEAVVLLTNLLENVEEFYELRDKIKYLMEDKEITEIKLINLFKSIVKSRLNEKKSDITYIETKKQNTLHKKIKNGGVFLYEI